MWDLRIQVGGVKGPICLMLLCSEYEPISIIRFILSSVLKIFKTVIFIPKSRSD